MPHRTFGKIAGPSPTARLAVAAAAVWLTVALGVVFLLVQEREATLERAGRNLAALALALESYTARSFQAVDLTLAGAVDALRLADDLPPHDPDFQAALERRLEFLSPYVRAIYIVDAQGRVLHDTDYPDSPALTPAAQHYFQAHRDNPSLVSSVAAPLENHPGLGWFVPVTRRLGTNTRFDGIAVAAVQPLYFESLFRRMGLGPSDVISFYYRNGVLISRYPQAGPATGDSFAGSPLFDRHLPQSDAGTFVAHREPGPAFLVSYRDVQGQPLVVSVAEQMSSVLAPWRTVAAGAAIALAALLTLLALLIVQFRRQQRVRERAQEQRAHAERMEALGHVTSGIAHDFNNLLSVVSSSLEVVSHATANEDARRAATDAAERAVARGAELIRRLSTFARSRPVELSTARLEKAIRGCEELLRRAAGHHVELLMDLTPDLPPCRLDETEFEVALVNLVINARDAMAGSGRIAIRTYPCEEDRRHVCVSVEDSGHGMSESVQRHAFEPYYTTKGNQGTGLGLAQVYGFMLQIGGETRIESRAGIGTKVELRFPLADPADGRAGA